MQNHTPYIVGLQFFFKCQKKRLHCIYIDELDNIPHIIFPLKVMSLYVEYRSSHQPYHDRYNVDKLERNSTQCVD